MQIFVQTRGKNTDYAFLSGAPSSRWWLDFRDFTSFEKPTLIVHGDLKEWRCFLSGIPSSRVDRVNTAIRYSVVMQGKCNESLDIALRLVAAWLKDITSAMQGTRVGSAMDVDFDEVTVERLLANRGEISLKLTEVERLVDNAFSKLPLLERVLARDAPTSWIGSSSSIRAQRELIARCSCIMHGDLEGFAAQLNLLCTVDEATVLADKIWPIAILADDFNHSSLSDIVQIEKKKPPAILRIGPKKLPWIRICIIISVLTVLIWIFSVKTTQIDPQHHVPQVNY